MIPTSEKSRDRNYKCCEELDQESHPYAHTQKVTVTVRGVAGAISLRPLHPRIAPQSSSHGTSHGELESSNEGKSEKLRVRLESLLVSPLNAVEFLSTSTKAFGI